MFIRRTVGWLSTLGLLQSVCRSLTWPPAGLAHSTCFHERCRSERVDRWSGFSGIEAEAKPRDSCAMRMQSYRLCFGFGGATAI